MKESFPQQEEPVVQKVMVTEPEQHAGFLVKK